MRESGLLGLFRVIFLCVRDGFSTTRAWLVMGAFALIAAVPVALVAGALALIIWLAAP